MQSFLSLLADRPFVPYIRESDFAVRKPWNYPERKLLDYLLIYVQEGLLIVTVNQVEHHFVPGEFCLIQPGDEVVLEGRTNTITPFAHLDFFYNDKREQSFPTRPGQLDLTPYSQFLQPRLNDFQGIHVPVHFHPAKPIPFRDTLLKMVGLWKSKDPFSRLEANQLAYELILSLFKQYSHSLSERNETPGELNWITSYFSLHLHEPLSIDMMAERAGLSSSHFSAKFRKEYGMPPHRYLLHLRIKHASELLVRTDYSIQQIAEFCGFADIHHFAKAFKRITNQTPKGFRDEAKV